MTHFTIWRLIRVLKNFSIEIKCIIFRKIKRYGTENINVSLWMQINNFKRKGRFDY